MGCGSGNFFNGNYYWTQVGLDWWSVEHRRGSLMLCGCSASPGEERNRLYASESNEDKKKYVIDRFKDATCISNDYF